MPRCLSPEQTRDAASSIGAPLRSHRSARAADTGTPAQCPHHSNLGARPARVPQPHPTFSIATATDRSRGAPCSAAVVDPALSRIVLRQLDRVSPARAQALAARRGAVMSHFERRRAGRGKATDHAHTPAPTEDAHRRKRCFVTTTASMSESNPRHRDVRTIDIVPEVRGAVVFGTNRPLARDTPRSWPLVPPPLVPGSTLVGTAASPQPHVAGRASRRAATATSGDTSGVAAAASSCCRDIHRHHLMRLLSGAASRGRVVDGRTILDPRGIRWTPRYGL